MPGIAVNILKYKRRYTDICAYGSSKLKVFVEFLCETFNLSIMFIPSQSAPNLGKQAEEAAAAAAMGWLISMDGVRLSVRSISLLGSG